MQNVHSTQWMVWLINYARRESLDVFWPFPIRQKRKENALVSSQEQKSADAKTAQRER